MIRGTCVGPKKRVVILRKPVFETTKRKFLEEVKLTFIDTASKMGHGRFQTSDEKDKFYGVRASKAK
jgi:large subunit ribosomal protein L3e